MITTLQDLVNTLNALYNPQTSQQDRLLADQLIQNWQTSNYVFPISLEAIATAPNSQLIMIVTLTLLNILKKSKNNLNESIINESIIKELFFSCLRRLRSEFSQQNTPCESNLVLILAFIALIYPQYFDAYHELNHQELLIFFEIIFCQANKIEYSLSEISFDKIHQLVPVVIELLSTTEVNRIWFSLHKYALCFTPEFQLFDQLLQKIQEASHNYSLLPGLLSLYEAVLQFEPMDLVSEQILYIAKFIRIMIPCAISLIKISNTKDGALQYASFIWSNTLEFGINFYGQQSLLNFSMMVFNKFLQYLLFFLPNPDEFFFLLEIASNLFGTAFHTNPTAFGNFLVVLLDLILKVTNEHPDFREPRMECCIKYLTSWCPPNFVEVVLSRCSNPTPGLFYTVSYFCKELRAPLVSPMTPILNPNCPTALAFIKRCCKLAPELSTVFMQITSNALSLSPFEGAEALCVLSKYYPDLFIENANAYINPLINALGNAPIEISKNLFATLFSILPRIHLPDEQMKQILTPIGSSFVATLSKFAAKGNEAIPYYRVFILDSIKGTAKVPLSPVFVQFFATLFNHINSLISGFWLDPSDQVQEYVCSILESALDRQWVTDKANVMSWICTMLPNNPIPGHFRVLRHLVELMPAPQVLTFLQNLPNVEDPPLIVESLKFMHCILLERNDFFFETFPLAFFIQPLKSNFIHVSEAALELLLDILQFPQSHTDADHIMKVIVEGTFTTFPKSFIPFAIKVLRTIALKHFGIEHVASYLESLFQQKTQALASFVQNLGNPEIQENVMIQLFEQIYREYKASH
ncbi:hypothetical protein TRFO_10571 [Tritrichomonas foetus]|uniref:Importin N-terminal domain-containing protein n=1 Tax=Tritrichomonas foetus TaxID=1144522 RepID=A0A1J4J8F3_9EUKA|nr:hypothetical protein TRFO_10571 [Tritrichomonas foetus]|eukprot:OHS95416.1 hypothetical protein TRFO_10571 [Tritrichomonas foetus]